MRRARRLIAGIALLCSAGVALHSGRAEDTNRVLALELIDRFYGALAPESGDLAAFLAESFQIIGSDGLHFDKAEYLTFPKGIVDYSVSGLVVRRDAQMLTATFDVTYHGTFEGVARTVPALPRLAVFREAQGEWSLVALAALGTGSNDVSAAAGEALARFLDALRSGEAEDIRQVVAPDFQILRADGDGDLLDGVLENPAASESGKVLEALVATSFSNTMVTRYTLSAGGGAEGSPRMTVFQRIGGTWLAAAHAELPAPE